MLDYRTHTFLTVCRTGSLTRAAAELHVTQPAVSQHIRQLERHYGCRLFTKTGRGVTPTAAGELLRRELGAMESDEGRLRAELDALEGEKNARPPLRLGCTRTVGDFVAPRILADHLRRHPNEQLRMRVGNTAELVGLLDGGEIDLRPRLVRERDVLARALCGGGSRGRAARERRRPAGDAPGPA